MPAFTKSRTADVEALDASAEATPTSAEKAKPGKTAKQQPPPFPDAVKPKVLLVPRYIRDRQKAAETLRRVYLAVGALLALVAVFSGYTVLAARSAAADLREAETARSAAQAEATRLQPVADYYAGLLQRQNTAMEALKGDTDYSRLVDAIYTTARKSGSQIIGLSVAPGAPCPGPNPFEPLTALGCATVVAEANGPVASARLMTALSSLDGIAGAAFSGAYGDGTGTGSDGKPTFQFTVNYSPDLLTMRFVPTEQQDAVRQSFASATDPAAQQAGQPATSTTGATP